MSACVRECVCVQVMCEHMSMRKCAFVCEGGCVWEGVSVYLLMSVSMSDV